MNEIETDFCDRLPGCHTGRLSLELQGREQAEWQRRIDVLTKLVERQSRQIAELISILTPEDDEDDDPRSMGWLGCDGLP